MSWFRTIERIRNKEELEAMCEKFYEVPRRIGIDEYISLHKDEKITVPNPEYPKNYINRIKSEIGKYDYILVDADPALMTAMVENGMKFILVHPDISAKAEWIGRVYMNDEKEYLAKLMKWTFELSIKSFKEFAATYPEITTYVLKNGQYISDVVNVIESGKSLNASKMSKVTSSDDLIIKMKNLEKVIKDNNPYVMASIAGKGYHIGRFKGVGIDSDNELTIDVDIDAQSCTTESYWPQLTSDEIDCFNWYIEDAKMDIAFGNSDWTSIYKKIVGEQVSEYAEKKMDKYRQIND
jgi:hypothetical protein